MRKNLLIIAIVGLENFIGVYSGVFYIPGILFILYGTFHSLPDWEAQAIPAFMYAFIEIAIVFEALALTRFIEKRLQNRIKPIATLEPPIG